MMAIALSLNEYVKRIADAAPPLNADQRDRVASLFRPIGDDVGVFASALNDRFADLDEVIRNGEGA